MGLGRGREECPVAKPLPTGVPAGRGVTEYAAKDHVIFFSGTNRDNTLRHNLFAPVLTLE